MDQLRIDTSHRHAVQDSGDFVWAAGTDATERHAFPPEGGFRRSACGEIRFTAAYGKRGLGACRGCLAALRDQLRAVVAALAAEGVHVDGAEQS